MLYAPAASVVVDAELLMSGVCVQTKAPAAGLPLGSVRCPVMVLVPVPASAGVREIAAPAIVVAITAAKSRDRRGAGLRTRAPEGEWVARNTSTARERTSSSMDRAPIMP